MTPHGPSTLQLNLAFEESKVARRIWPVRELVAQVREQVEQKHSDVWVEGEISNLRAAPSGHIYFTLKDAEAKLPAILFRRQSLLLRFRPEDGLHVLVRGCVSVYEQRGQLQLVAETMEPVGAGSLQLAFEQLREKLRAEGLFENARKRPLPAFPRTVGIVTSPAGAVIRDFLNIVGRRHSGLNVLLWPATVQGDSAPAEIEAAIAGLNESGLVDIIVLARGGGSLEDLAAFNSERVARAIVASRLPLVSAVGHETDYTIADFVADLRAPTPSAAAELITEAQHRIADSVASLTARLDRAVRYQLLQARQQLGSLPVDRAYGRMAALLRGLEQCLDDLGFRMEAAATEPIRLHHSKLADLTAVVLRHDPRRLLGLARERLIAVRSRLDRSFEHVLQGSAKRVYTLDVRLRALSPLAVLDRGYALVQGANGALIRSTAQLATGETVSTRLNEGVFTSRVETIAKNKGRKRSKSLKN